MFPPSQGLNLDIDAISGITGSISIACWVVVFSPQIIENFRRGSAEGLSVVFIVVWLLGDVFNIVGAVLQRVLPTMIILAIYYTLADIVLLAQCFYYKGFTLKDEVRKPEDDDEPPREPSETSALLGQSRPAHISDFEGGRRRSSFSSFTERLFHDGEHLSPATPFVDTPAPDTARQAPRSALKSVLFNLVAVILVCAAGFLGWLFTYQPPENNTANEGEDSIQFNVLGQIGGYICCVLYLGSRVPQLYLNYKRQSTEGISMLFFIFACLGNLTYVISILAYKPVCHGHGGHCRPGEAGDIYGRYFLVNLSWLLGSFGTLLLDAGVFVQYFMYKKDDSDEAVV
ncbi:putative pq loop repeat protein [Lasiodiplodia theobromae]|uniref:Putative vacuolar amino acid transporter YPQ3 n=1 Tax=Lasiodiplodia theobromae TaxID=45133 RepID=A0A5N5DMT8_9PEZI|nr:Pq loop repeat protein [Lasiodiplodia theobromae]KAB2578134.1 putative vacuolar amino acid transporter YPQ3 [Lasiodiplodia theobromae]KAF4544129.1 Pq loop repeat protein [Lasiodiplodia theobromae]KAF9641382.1 putative pq loop repeat protein [Lasiodiplodia theobromae]